MANRSKKGSFDPYGRSASLSVRFFPFRELTPCPATPQRLSQASRQPHPRGLYVAAGAPNLVEIDSPLVSHTRAVENHHYSDEQKPKEYSDANHSVSFLRESSFIGCLSARSHCLFLRLMATECICLPPFGSPRLLLPEPCEDYCLLARAQTEQIQQNPLGRRSDLPVCIQRHRRSHLPHSRQQRRRRCRLLHLVPKWY